MDSLRKESLKRCLLGFLGSAFASVLGFFMFFALPPVAIALPAAIWTFWGFEDIHLFTLTHIESKWIITDAILNFFFILVLEFVVPGIIDFEFEEPIKQLIKTLSYVLLSVDAICQILFWIFFLKGYIPEVRTNHQARKQ